MPIGWRAGCHRSKRQRGTWLGMAGDWSAGCCRPDDAREQCNPQSTAKYAWLHKLHDLRTAGSCRQVELRQSSTKRTCRRMGPSLSPSEPPVAAVLGARNTRWNGPAAAEDRSSACRHVELCVEAAGMEQRRLAVVVCSMSGRSVQSECKQADQHGACLVRSQPWCTAVAWPAAGRCKRQQLWVSWLGG